MASTTPSILIVEPSAASIEILLRLLKNDYQVSIVNSGEACLTSIVKTLPDLLIVSDQLVDICALELCTKVRQGSDTFQIPVLVSSETDDPVKLLAAYEAGYDDFVTIPTNDADELLLSSRVSQLIQHGHHPVKQAPEHHKASSNAVMQGMGEMSNIILFLQNSSSCQDYESLGNAFFDTLINYDLAATLMIYSNNGPFFMGSYGTQHAIEYYALESCREKGKLVELGNRSIYNGSQCSFVIRNMPVNDEAKYARLKSHLATMLVGMDARLMAIDTERELIDKQASIRKTIDDTRSTLALLDAANKQQQSDHAAMLNDLGENMESAFFSLGLTDEQEEFLTGTIGEARLISDALYETADDLDARLQNIISRLTDAMANKKPLDNSEQILF